jgi:quercetin dioxygenase-like cupin family protein
MGNFLRVITVVSLFAIATAMGGTRAGAQSVATPTAAMSLFYGDGITSARLAQDFPILKVGNAANLVLRRWILQPGATSPIEISRLPELGHVAGGSVAYEDAFGTPATADTGSVITVSPGIAGAHSQITNNGDGPATLLVLSYFAPQADSTSKATPDAEGFHSETLIDGNVGPFTADILATFIGIATFEPGAQSGRLAHNGPVCVFVDDGELTIPGLTSSNGAASAASGCLTATTPLEISNVSDAPATVLVVGAIEGAGIMGNFFKPDDGSATPPPD